MHPNSTHTPLNLIRNAHVAMEKPNNKIIWLYSPVLKFLKVEASAKTPLETGGILMGYFGQPGNIPVIMWATGAGPQSIHKRDYYKPDAEFDESQIALLYEKTGRQIVYLGDWHTHLVPCTCLSFRDKCTLRRIAKCKSARVEMPLMLILSYDDQWYVTVWQGRLHKNRFWGKHLSTNLLTTHLFKG